MKRHLKDHSGGVNLGVIITPFLDMAFQILSFFIMTYHPSALEGHIPGSLVPPENVAKKSKDSNVNQMDLNQSVPEDLLNEELNQAIQVKVKALGKGQTDEKDKTRREGQLTQILLKQPTDATYQVVADTDNEIKEAVKLLEKQLKQVQGADKGNIKIEGDGELRQAYVMMVYDACKKAGFTKIHFVPPPLSRPEK